MAQNGTNLAQNSAIFETKYTQNIITPQNPRILIAYFSYSGNTEKAAEILADLTGADITEITMESPYRGNICTASQIDLYQNIHPQIDFDAKNPSDYDVVALGYPTWWSSAPMPIFSFLERFDLSSKTLLCFSPNGGTMFGDSVSDLEKRLPRTLVANAFEFYYSGSGNLWGELAAWLNSNKIVAKEKTSVWDKIWR